MQRVGRLIVAIIATCSTVACLGRERPPLPVVSGPEAKDLLAAARGYVVMSSRTTDGWMSELALTAVPSLAAHVIRPPQNGSYKFVRLFSGPDDRGRVAYIQENGWGDSAQLSIIDADGRNNEVIATENRRLDQALGEHLALAPVGGAIAFMSKVKKSWPNGEYISTATLTVWFPDRKPVAVIAIDANDEGISWFPDGAHLAYVTRVQRHVLTDSSTIQLTRGTPECEGEATGQETIPVIYIVDVASGARRALHAGTHPVVSTDGASVLLECGSAILVDNAGRNPRPVPVPGDLQRPLALLDGHLVVYWGLPTEGAPVVRSPYGSFGAGTQLVTIKVADIATGRFQTIIPLIDPRENASFGQLRDTVGVTRELHSSAPALH